MLEHLKRLQDQLAQTTLSPQAVRDGLLSAYLVVSRFNQAEGDPQVGLKQGTPALADYLSGFMSAVFTERGFSFDQPTLDQLSELKMMADGVVQLYAMPEDLQSFLNELYDQLMARGHGIPSRVSAAVLERLDHRVPEPGPATETLEPSPPAETQAPEVPSADAFKGIWDIGDLPPSPDLASGAADPDGLTGEQRPSSALGDEVAFEDLPLPDAPKVRASRRAEPDLADADVISEAEVVGETPIKTATRKKKASVKKAAKKKAGVKAAPRRRRVQPQALKISLSSLTAEAAREKAEAFTLPVGEPTPAGPEAVAARSLEPELASPDRPLPGDAENLDALLEAVEGKAIPLSQPEKMPAFDPSAFAAEPGSSETPAPSTEAFDPSAFDAELGSSETPAPTTQAFDPSVFAAELEGARSPEPTPAEPAPASEVFDPAALAAELESIEIKPKPEERLSFDTFEPVTPEPRSSGSSSDETAAISQPHPRAEEWNPLPLETLSNPSASTAEEPRLGPEAQEEPGETEPPAKPAVEETPWWAVPPAIVDPRDPAPSVEQTSSEPMPGFDDLLSKMSEPAERSGTALSPEITVDTETGERAQTLDDILASFDSKTPAAADQETSVEVEAPDLLSAMTAEPEPVVEPRPEPFQPITRPEPSRPPSMIADDAFRAPGQDDAFTMGPDVKEDLLGTGTVIFAPSAKPAEATLTSSTKAAPKPSEPAAEVDTMPSEETGRGYSGDETVFGVTSGGGGGEGAEERPRKGGGWGAIFLFLLGIALGGGGAYYWYGIRMGTEAQSQLKVREERIQALTTDFNTAQQETKRLQTQLDESKKLMAKTPVAPKVMKAGSGVMLYWIDSGNYFRKYVVYQAKGKSNNWDKLNATPLDENFILITKPPKGAWRFSIAALDTEGKETSHSEELSVVFPLKK